MPRLFSRLLAVLTLTVVITTPATAVDPTPTPTPALSDDAALYDLTPSGGAMSPAFDSEVTDYLLDIDTDLLDIDYVEARGARVRCYFDSWRSSCYDLSITPGEHRVLLIVTAEDLTTTRRYAIDIARPLPPTPSPSPTPRPTPKPTPTPRPSTTPTPMPETSPPASPDLPPTASPDVLPPSPPVDPRPFALVDDELLRSERIGIETGGLLAHSTAAVWLERPPLYLGTLTVDADGTASGTLRLPVGVLDGETTVRLSGLAPNGDPLLLVAPLYIGRRVEGIPVARLLILFGLVALAVAGGVAGLSAYRRAHAPREKLPWEE